MDADDKYLMWSPYRQIVEDELRMRKGVQMSPGEARLKKLVREAQVWNNRESMKRFKKRLERERIQSGLLTDEQQMAIALRSLERK